MIPPSQACKINEFARSADSSVFLSHSIRFASACWYWPSPETVAAIASLKRDSPKRVCFLVMTTSELNASVSLTVLGDLRSGPCCGEPAAQPAPTKITQGHFVSNRRFAAHRMNQPPLTSRVSPVMNRLSTRNAIAAAISSGWPTRFSGVEALNSAIFSGVVTRA